MYRIRHAARLTGLSPELIRAWERRYGLLDPSRTDAGYRVYSDEDLEVLKGAKALVERGQSIGDVARMPRETLLKAAGEGPRLDVATVLPGTNTTPAGDDEVARAITSAMGAVERFDREAFEVALFPLLGVGSLSPPQMCEQVLLPLLHAIGEAWEQGKLSVAAEHFGSTLVRNKIVHMLEFQPRGRSANRLVCACPDDERHEGGLLAFAVHGAAQGWQVVYLGASTPIADAFAAAVRSNARVLALSLTTERGEAEVDALTAELAKFGARHPNVTVLAGGYEAEKHRLRLEAVGVRISNRVSLDLSPYALPASA